MNNEKKTFVILTPGFPENEADTACLPWLQNFVRELHEDYPAIRLIILSFQYPFTNKPYYWHAIKIIPFGGSNKGGLSKWLLRYKINAYIRKIYLEEKITGILSLWYGECARAGHLFAQKRNIRHICWVQGQDAKKENKYPGQLSLKGEHITVVSDFLQDHFEQNHHVRPAHVIPPGADAGQFDKTITAKDIDILAAGSLIPLKQYDVFIEAVAEVKRKLPDIKAVLIGKGPEEANIKQLVDKYSLQHNIILTGELPYKDVLRYMQRAKIFLHPSSYEGFGCVCAEAQYAGAFVIRFTRPMKKEMQNTATVNTKEEMIAKTIERLNSNQPYINVKEFPVESAVRKMMPLFGL
jgi:glycosyltransferase involved in cell wall biosynthesis